ncbi:uncharacterized protein CELE_Y113G7A.14 [Caenorhabditis elegans]|uniref:Uncharacterized protein n=1 Tax=Caenorhabditis elegans TaxID=6239 RepID=Q9U2Y4_CAEEL|nr:Uncharacterized protein CELE_Y113G7A.14 [Caenorhabditis elegans]CAB60484.1 Uncharacterized protein CELE_Y113G7A.14 [Caenorhabditis elegans]|eukprot:NP_507881.1 Uncharacterized protein CELE_Y113G7A.14 [Caenorhabditis elegans]
MSNYTSLIDDIENLTVPTSSDDPFPSPADPFEDYVNVTDYTIIEIKNKNGTESVRLFEYFNVNPFLVYAICGIAAVIVIIAIISLILWLKNHKTRVINETTDPVLTSSYQDGKGCLSCCCPAKPQITVDQRQNSASNLESYGRPPLPQSAYFMDRPKSQESFTIDTSNLAMYIDGIEEIPNRDPPRGVQRELPKYRLQQYQLNQ